MQHTLKFAALTLVIALSNMASADFLPVCKRTTGVKISFEQLLKKSCGDITAKDLLTIKRFAPSRKGITAFQANDLTGLTNVEILNIRSNPFTELPIGLLKDLIHLKTLVIISTELQHYPDDFLADNPELVNLHSFRNKTKTITESVFKRLENMPALEVMDIDTQLQSAELERLQKMFPDGGTVQLIVN